MHWEMLEHLFTINVWCLRLQGRFSAKKDLDSILIRSIWNLTHGFHNPLILIYLWLVYSRKKEIPLSQRKQVENNFEKNILRQKFSQNWSRCTLTSKRCNGNTGWFSLNISHIYCAQTKDEFSTLRASIPVWDWQPQLFFFLDLPLSLLCQIPQRKLWADSCAVTKWSRIQSQSQSHIALHWHGKSPSSQQMWAEDTQRIYIEW